MRTALLETYPGLDAGARAAIDRTNALALFPRLGAAPPPDAVSPLDQVRHTASRVLMRGVTRLINTR
jgi:6-methylsalicylate decarboxylase